MCKPLKWDACVQWKEWTAGSGLKVDQKQRECMVEKGGRNGRQQAGIERIERVCRECARKAAKRNSEEKMG